LAPAVIWEEWRDGRLEQLGRHNLTVTEGARHVRYVESERLQHCRLALRPAEWIDGEEVFGVSKGEKLHDGALFDPAHSEVGLVHHAVDSFGVRTVAPQ